MRVAIIGQGYVGLTISAFAAAHHEVVGFDMNAGVVERLNKGVSHIEGVDSALLKKWVEAGKYRATTNAADIADAQVVVIAVPTPLDKNRKPDLTFIESACKTIGENLKGAALIINESTSFPGTVRGVIKPMIEKYSKIKLHHEYAVSPERVDPGRVDWNQKNTPRLYAGLTPSATAGVREFYSTFCDNLVEVSSPEVAEAAKLFENTFRQVNIALVNEFAQITNALGISVHETLDAANTKPYGFMRFNPSAGVGGHCIPVDPSYLAHVAAGVGVPATFIERANEVNLEMPKYVVARVAKENGGSLKGKRVQVIGVAYKPNVADTRETPAELVIDELERVGAVISWHDPVVGAWHGQSSSALGDVAGAAAEIAIVVTLHGVIDSKAVVASAPYVFDTTGKLSGIPGL
jgi:UDP-N-acetyl-D-glucosamine dehydrogenase